MQTSFSYTNSKKDQIDVNISEDLADIVGKADSDYLTSRKYIFEQEFYIWRASLKAYHLSTHDRKVQLWEDGKWKQNISIGLVRSFIDILISGIEEKPVVFNATWVNKAGIENRDSIASTLTYISDVSKFHREIKEAMRNGLITWEILLRLWYKKTNKREKYYSLTDSGNMIDEVVEIEEENFPYATNISIFNIFPDPYTWPLRYVTERDVVSYIDFIKIFWFMIRSKANKSPFKAEEFLSCLSSNPNNSDTEDYGAIVHEIHQKINKEYEESDYFTKPKFAISSPASVDWPSKDTNVTQWLIEFKITWYINRVVLIANNYPIYIWENPFGFIPYIVKPASNTKTRFWEWVWYVLKPLEDIGNSFVSNYFDSARSIANPKIVAQKNLMIDENELEDGTPGWVIYTEDNLNGKAVYRLETGWLNDYGVLDLIQSIATRLIGISEYDQGISAWERTATGANAVANSSMKRMNPYISNFLDATSIVAQMWLSMVKKYWGASQFIYILDEEWARFEKNIKKKDLIGNVNITLDIEGMFTSNKNLEVKKLIDMYNTLSSSWFANSPEIAKEIVKKYWYIPSRFITAPWEWVKPDNASDIAAIENQTSIPWVNAQAWEELRDSVTPVVDLWNQWQGRK